MQLFSHLIDRRLAQQPLVQRVEGLLNLFERFLFSVRQPYGPALVRERTNDRLLDPPRSVRRESHFFSVVVLPRGLDAIQVAAELGSVTAVKEGVKAGLGITLISEITVSSEVEAGLLKIVPVQSLKSERFFYLVRDKRRIFSPAAEALWKFLLKA